MSFGADVAVAGFGKSTKSAISLSTDESWTSTAWSAPFLL